MDLDNPSETIMHYLFIGGMTCLGHWDAFSLMSALVYANTHLTRPTVNRDVRLSTVIIH